MNLYSYLSRLEATLRTRQELDLQVLQIEFLEPFVFFEARVCFYDGSILTILERLRILPGGQAERVRYRYHYQNADSALIFRYDNAPHYPALVTFPHHKHDGNTVIAATAPDLARVLQEIDELIYPHR